MKWYGVAIDGDNKYIYFLHIYIFYIYIFFTDIISIISNDTIVFVVVIFIEVEKIAFIILYQKRIIIFEIIKKSIK
jgi:hypothetical protein